MPDDATPPAGVGGLRSDPVPALNILCRVLLRSVNALTCAGCTIPACLVFNSVIIRRLPGSIPEEVVVTLPETAGINFAVCRAVLARTAKPFPCDAAPGGR